MMYSCYSSNRAGEKSHLFVNGCFKVMQNSQIVPIYTYLAFNFFMDMVNQLLRENTFLYYDLSLY